MPGLIDAHIHITVPFIFKVTLNALRQMNAQLTKNFYPDIEFFKRGYPVAMRNVEKMKKAGARIGVGTDT